VLLATGMLGIVAIGMRESRRRRLDIAPLLRPRLDGVRFRRRTSSSRPEVASGHLRGGKAVLNTCTGKLPYARMTCAGLVDQAAMSRAAESCGSMNFDRRGLRIEQVNGDDGRGLGAFASGWIDGAVAAMVIRAAMAHEENRR
jgi:hypothetical protein